MGRIVCCVCGKQMGTHAGNGDSHGYCDRCFKEEMKKAAQAAAEHRQKKGR